VPFKGQINYLFIAGRILEFIAFSLKFSCFHHIVRGQIVSIHESSYRWLSKKVHVQGVVFFQEQGHTYSMPSVCKKYYNAVDETFDDAINLNFFHLGIIFKDDES
jgi:hypothetical protein